MLAPQRLPDINDCLTAPDANPLELEPIHGEAAQLCDRDESWGWQFMPAGVVYQPYLASEKEPRFSVLYGQSNGRDVLDTALGWRVAFLRYGTADAHRPDGIELDLAGAVFPRLDVEHTDDLESADFCFGFPLTYGVGPLRFKTGYNHISAHVGDEFLIRNPGFSRVNYVRNDLVFGSSLDVTEDLRIYAEVDWAFECDVAKPWQFQFGAEHNPSWHTRWGVPFSAIHGTLRQESQFGGNITVQCGLRWRPPGGHGFFRVGAEYFNGKSSQTEFYDDFERKIGLAFWCDH